MSDLGLTNPQETLLGHPVRSATSGPRVAGGAGAAPPPPPPSLPAWDEALVSASRIPERRVALVTGCGKHDGIGQAIARALAADGAAVVVADYRPTGVPNRRQEILGGEEPGSWSGLDTLVGEIEAAGGTATSVLGDIGDEHDAEEIVAAALNHYGRLDILVNNAAAPTGARP